MFVGEQLEKPDPGYSYGRVQELIKSAVSEAVKKEQEEIITGIENLIPYHQNKVDDSFIRKIVSFIRSREQ